MGLILVRRKRDNALFQPSHGKMDVRETRRYGYFSNQLFFKYQRR